LGLLSSFDRGLPEDAPEALFNILRVNRDVLSSSSVGLLAADKRIAEGGWHNFVGGVDGSFSFLERYSLKAQLLWSHSYGSFDDDGSTPRSMEDAAAFIFLSRSSQRFN